MYRRALDRLRAAGPGERASILQAVALTEESPADAPGLSAEAGWTPLWADGRSSAFHLRLPGHRGSVRAVVFIDVDGRTMVASAGTVAGGTVLATAGEDGVVRLWDADSGHQGDKHRYTGTGLAVTTGPDGPVLAVTQRHASADLFDARTGRTAGSLHCGLGSHRPGHACDTYSLRGENDHNTRCVAAAMVDGRPLFATGGTAKGVPLWDPATTDVVRFIDYAWPAGVVAFGEVDGRVVLVTGGPGLATVWDPTTGEHIAKLRDKDDRGVPDSTAITFGTAGGRTVIATGAEQRIDLWEPLTGRHLLRLPGHGRRGAAGLAAGRDVLAAAHDDEIRLWDTTTGERKSTITVPDGIVTCLARVPTTGRDLIVSGAQDGTVRLWDLASARPLATLATFARPVSALTAAVVDDAPCVFALASSGRVTACRLDPKLTDADLTL